MTEQNLDQQSMGEIIQAKLEADEKVITMIVDEVEQAFKDNPAQAEVLSKIAVKLYHNSNDIDELNVQGMYISAVVDALTKVLVEDKGIITHSELQAAVKEAHDISMASIEEANQIYADKVAAQASVSSPVSEVMTV